MYYDVSKMGFELNLLCCPQFEDVNHYNDMSVNEKWVNMLRPFPHTEEPAAEGFEHI